MHSIRHTPIVGCGGISDKKDKRQYNRSFRHRMKTAVKKLQLDMLPLCEATRHGGNWNFNKDGKIYLRRKEVKKHPEWMRR